VAEPLFRNPFRPGAGHAPPYLAGRVAEREEFERLLQQDAILENLLLTGLRGVGKTVLLETFKPIALSKGWLWAGADLSESTSVDETRLATRILTDLSVVTSNVVIGQRQQQRTGFLRLPDLIDQTLNYQTLASIFDSSVGLVSDRLKATLEFAWRALEASPLALRGIVFAYDEAQTMADHARKEEYPLSVLLDVFQSLQRQGVPFLLALTGLPTLFPKLVESRTYSERMFRVLFLDRLEPHDVRDAIVKPIQDELCPISLTERSIDQIARHSGGYPYFIQFICREMFDAFIGQVGEGTTEPSVPITEITRKLDSDFFAGRWSRVTDRQRDLLLTIAVLDQPEKEFTVQEIVEKSREKLPKPFSGSHTNQMLASLTNAGLVYKNRHGKYSFAVPLLGQFIRRQYPDETQAPLGLNR